MNTRRKVLNRDEGNLIKTNTWTPLIEKKKQTQVLDVKFRNGFQ